jgi:hypothetical protein
MNLIDGLYAPFRAFFCKTARLVFCESSDYHRRSGTRASTPY